MNTSSSVETKNPFSFKDTLLKALPDGSVSRILFWGALPVFLLMFTCGIGVLSGSVFSVYLPFFSLLGGCLCLRWKKMGLCASYVALGLLVLAFYREIPAPARLWQMGLVLALSLDFLIVLLSIEEVETSLHQLKERAHVKAKELTQAQLHFQQQSHEWEDLQKGFEDEIRDLKEEAEQRRIERHEECRQLELIQSEIELLNSQKERFIAAAKKGEAALEKEDRLNAALAQLETCPPQLEDTGQLTEALAKAQQEIQQLKEQTNPDISLKEELTKAQERIMRLQASTLPAPSSAELRRAEGMYKQLRFQFEEKSRLLTQARKDLFQTEGKVLALQHEAHLAKLAPDFETEAAYEKALDQLLGEVSRLESEVADLEEIVSQSLS